MTQPIYWPVVALVIVAAWSLCAWSVIAAKPEPAHPGRHRMPDHPGFHAPVPIPYVVPRDTRIDDWTSDLPTAVIPAIMAPVPDAPRPVEHTSPSRRAQQLWGTDCPIFAALADEWGYEPGRGLVAA